MADKGFMGGNMKFGVGDDDEIPEQNDGPILPLRILVVSNFVPAGEWNAGAEAPSEAITLDPKDPEALFAKLRPRISIEVPSVLAEGRPTKIELAPHGLKSFRPDVMLTEIKILRSLMDGRAIVERVGQGELTATQAEEQLSRVWGGSPFAREVLGLTPLAPSKAKEFDAGPSAVAAQSGGMGSILDMVDMGSDSGGGGATTPSSVEDDSARAKIASIIAQVAMSARGGRGARAIEGPARIDQAISAQLGAILQHPEVRRLEKAYRGLRFLLERATNIPGVIVDAISVGQAGAPTTFARAAKRASGARYSFAIVDVEVDGTAKMFAELEEIADHAEAFVVPALVNGTEGLLGVGDLSSIEKLDNKAALFTAPHRAPWRSSANKPALRWVAITANGTLSRAPYDKQSSRVRGAVITELPNDHEGFVWMNPAYAVATLMLASFKDTGWPARIIGPRHGLVENLPVREVEDEQTTVAIPTRAFVSTDSQKQIARMGVLLLASAPNSDAAYVHSAPTGYVKPEKTTYDVEGAEERHPPRISLTDQLFIARLVQFVRALCAKIPAESDPSEVQPILHAAVWALFDKAPPGGPQIEVKVGSTKGGAVASIKVEPRRFLGVELEEFGFEMPLG